MLHTWGRGPAAAALRFWFGSTAICAAALFLPGNTAVAQDALGWNAPRALQLVERARVRRELPRGDSTLQNYQAKANGYVYFYLDRRETDDRTLVKVDQVALDLFWKRPNLAKQRIVGMRDVSRLPNKMYYHLDHLTVVQNGFGDVIKMGDGDEVRDVPHPAARGADSVYDYRLADSVTLQMGGNNPEVRVYEIQVRPKRTNRSALIGSMFVDRNSADIVRMTFTFTPASYVDRRLDYINVSLDNGLFGGQYWLPNEQSLEIRRQIPELDFAAGAVIKGRMHISQYAFNQPIPDSVFYGRPVSAAPEAQRKTYAFPEDIYGGLATEGLAPPPQMQDLRARAAALVRENHLSGLPPWRVYIPNASSVLRRNHAEGWYAGLGGAYVPSQMLRVDALGGFAFRAQKPQLSIRLQSLTTKNELTLRAFYNQPRDAGPITGIPPGLNTVSVLFGGTDYTDYFFTSGGALETVGRSRWAPTFALRYEVQRAAMPLEAYRLQTFSSGNAVEATFGLRRSMPDRALVGWSAQTSGSLVHFSASDSAFDIAKPNGVFVRLLGNAQFAATSENKRTTFSANVDAGLNSREDTPGQYDFLLGGRETLPGYRYREFDVARFAVLNAEISRTIAAPWLQARLLGAVGALGRDFNREYYTPGGDILGTYTFFTASPGRVRASGGVGVGLFWDVIRVDVVRGSELQTLFSVRKEFWDMM